jgi:effector-binding domain-containing protein
MQLTLEPDTVTWPETHYLFIETLGVFQDTAPKAWQQLHELTPEVAAHSQITRYFSLYKMDQQIYRAGVGVAVPPSEIPAGLQYELVQRGQYLRFTLTGPYSQLGEASGRVWRIIEETKAPLRNDFNIENYVNDPRTTPEDQLLTEILFPVA